MFERFDVFSLTSIKTVFRQQRGFFISGREGGGWSKLYSSEKDEKRIAPFFFFFPQGRSDKKGAENLIISKVFTHIWVCFPCPPPIRYFITNGRNTKF